MHDFGRVLEAATAKLLAWDVRAGMSVALLCSEETLPILRQAYFTAAKSMGAVPVILMYPGRPNYTGLPEHLVGMLHEVDTVADLHGVAWSYSDAKMRFAHMRRAATARTGRYDPHGGAIPLHIFGGDAAELVTLINCPPDAVIAERSARAQQLIDSASVIRITSRLGTDLTMERGDRESFAPWMGQVAFYPPDESASGRVMYVGGFRACAPSVMTSMVYEPVAVEIDRGKIVHISTETRAGAMISEWFKGVRDPRMYQLAHVNIGLDPRIVLHNLDNFALHFNYGGILLGVGSNFMPDHGGGNRATGHIEMHLTGADYWVDDRMILEDGEYTQDSGLREPSRREATR